MNKYSDQILPCATSYQCEQTGAALKHISDGGRNSKIRSNTSSVMDCQHIINSRFKYKFNSMYVSCNYGNYSNKYLINYKPLDSVI